MEGRRRERGSERGGGEKGKIGEEEGGLEGRWKGGRLTDVMNRFKKHNIIGRDGEWGGTQIQELTLPQTTVPLIMFLPQTYPLHPR